MRPSIRMMLRRDRSTVVAALTMCLASAMAFLLPTPANATPGATLWLQRYSATTPGFDDIGRAVAFSPDGSRVFSTGDSNPDIATIAYDARTGERLWSRRDEGVGLGGTPVAIIVSPDGTRVFVGSTIRAYPSGLDQDFRVLAYDATTGSLLWARRYDGPGHGLDWFGAAAISPGGSTVYVTGTSTGARGPGTAVDPTTIAYDAATGAVRWRSRYGHGPGGASDIAVSPDGSRVVVAGSVTPRNVFSSQFLAISYDAATGTEQWTRTYGDPTRPFDGASRVSISPDGSSLYVAGKVGTGGDVAVLAYHADTGVAMWNQVVASGAVQPYFVASAVSPDGGSLFLAENDFGSTADLTVDAFRTSNGSPLWALRVDGPAHDEDAVEDLVLSPDGTALYAAGWESLTDRTFAALTVAIDPVTGHTTWRRAYGGPATSPSAFADAVAVSPDGTEVATTGVDLNDAGYYHRFTIAYGTS